MVQRSIPQTYFKYQTKHEIIVDKELLKKRSEHNNGELSTLEEISLHQFDLEKIENLDIYCKSLKILLLQNNQISKIGI